MRKIGNLWLAPRWFQEAIQLRMVIENQRKIIMEQRAKLRELGVSA